jgi:hypothetical protein
MAHDLERLRRAQKNNELFAANLKDGLKAMPKLVLGVTAATALDRAIRETKHDSSRAAANWDLSFGGSGVRTSLSPSAYGERPAGQRGDRGTNENVVLAHKVMYYGYAPVDGGSGLFEPEAGMRLYKSLRIGLSGEAPAVILFNPVMNIDNARRDGGPEHGGNTYAYNAFYGEQGDIVGTGAVTSLVGNGYIPVMVKEISQQVRWATANKKLWASMFGGA